MRVISKKEICFIWCIIFIWVIIMSFLIYNKVYKNFYIDENPVPHDLLNVKVLKPLKQGKYANDFLIRINDHDYYVSINKSVHNVIFFHDITCKFCKKNKSFYPYSFSILDGYDSKMMQEIKDENTK